MDFLADFNVESDDVKVEQRQGRKTGIALAFLNSEDDVQRACDELDQQYIGTRFINVGIPKLEVEDAYE